MNPSQRFERKEVEKKLKNIKASGTPGPDKAWSRVLHYMADLLPGPLTIIFTKLREGLPHLQAGRQADWPGWRRPGPACP